MLTVWELMFLIGCLICVYNPLLLVFELFEFYNFLIFGFLGVVSNCFTLIIFFIVYLFKYSCILIFYQDFLYYLFFICVFFVTLLFLLYLVIVIKSSVNMLVSNLLVGIFLISSFFYFLVEDYFLFYILVEFQTMLLYILYNITLVYASYYVRGGIRFFILSIFMSLILLLGISFIYLGSGTFVLEELFFLDMFNLQLFRLNFNFICYKVGLVLVYCVFFFKLGLFPFYVWMLEIFIFIRNFYFVFYVLMSKIPLYFFFIKTVINIGYLFFFNIIFIFSIIIGILNLYREDDIRKFIIYSSMVQFGILSICLVNLNYFIGVAVVCLYFNYLIVFLSLYLLCGKFVGFFSSLLYLNGLGRLYVPIILIFSVFLLSVIGVPPLLGFIGKVYLFLGLLIEGNLLLCILVLFVSILSSIYYFSIIRSLIFGMLYINNNYIYGYSFMFKFIVYIVGISFMGVFLCFDLNVF